MLPMSEVEEIRYRPLPGDTLEERTALAAARVKKLQKAISDMAGTGKWTSSWRIARAKKRQRRIDGHYRFVNAR